MSTEGRTATADAAGHLAGAVREAGFVHLVAAADGDALAAAGLLARGCRAADVPFQANVVRTDAERERRLAGAEPETERNAKSDATRAANNEQRDLEPDELAVLVGDGRDAADHDTEDTADHVVSTRGHPASVTAHAVATDLGAEPAPTLALAGAAAAGVRPGAGTTADLLETADDVGVVERRPGVAIPVEDVAKGLTSQTLVHAGFAGDPDRATELVREAGVASGGDSGGDPIDDSGENPIDDSGEDLADADRQRLASLVALEVAGDGRAPPRAAGALERVLRPYVTPGGIFATVGGYADVLEATARRAPGIGVALALDGNCQEAALDVWREHGRAAHATIRSATTGRYDGLLAVRPEEGCPDDGSPVETVARLVLDARSPEPAVLVVDDAEAAAVATPDADIDVGAGIRAAVAAVGGEAGGHASRGYARHEGDPRAFVSAFREAEL